MCIHHLIILYENHKFFSVNNKICFPPSFGHPVEVQRQLVV
jgi:hypothetical protein